MGQKKRDPVGNDADEHGERGIRWWWGCKLQSRGQFVVTTCHVTIRCHEA